MDNRICVIQLDSRKNDFVKGVAALNRKYCESNGYDYVFVDSVDVDRSHYDARLFDFQDRENGAAAFLSMYTKYKLAEEYLRSGYGHVVFVDSDAMFVNPYRKIEEFLDGSSFYIARDIMSMINNQKLCLAAGALDRHRREKNAAYVDLGDSGIEVLPGESLEYVLTYIANNPSGLNAGFMIFRNDQAAFDFLRDIKDCYRYCECLNPLALDQSVLVILLKMKKYRDAYRKLPVEFQGTCRNIHRDFRYDEDRTFVCHEYGNSYDGRVLALKTVSGNKWWRKYESEHAGGGN